MITESQSSDKVTQSLCACSVWPDEYMHIIQISSCCSVGGEWAALWSLLEGEAAVKWNVILPTIYSSSQDNQPEAQVNEAAAGPKSCRGPSNQQIKNVECV